jgi:hypothetical protein
VRSSVINDLKSVLDAPVAQLDRASAF